jgi:hypothetical protein
MKERSTMSLQPRLIQLSLVSSVLLGLLIGVYLVATSRRFSKRDPAGAIIKHPVDAPPNDALEYWTEDKMRNAKPANLPNVTNLRRGKKHPQRPPHPTGPEHS